MRDVVRALLRGAKAVLLDAALVRFAAVGLITTTLDFVLFSLLAVGASVGPVKANVASYSCGVVTSFILNRSWTFGADFSSARVERHALKFLASNMVGLLLSSTLVAVMALLMPNIAAKAISVALVFVWNYAAARLWVFRE